MLATLAGMSDGYWTTRGYANSRIANSRTGHLAVWSTRGLDNSRTGQVADWTTRGCHRRLCVLSFPVWRHLQDRELSSPRLVQSASWLVRELSSPRVDQSARCPVRKLAIRELAYPRVVQLPVWQPQTAADHRRPHFVRWGLSVILSAHFSFVLYYINSG